MIWDEDSKVWCGQGVAIRLLGLLRLMASNIVGQLRCRYQERRGAREAVKRGWQPWCELLVQVLMAVSGAGVAGSGLKDA